MIFFINCNPNNSIYIYNYPGMCICMSIGFVPEIILSIIH